MTRAEQNIKDLKTKSISIIGLGRSGIASAQLANYIGASVFVSDSSATESALNNLNLLKQIGINGEIGGHTEKVYNAELMVISPGVPADSMIVTAALQRGIKVIGEIEFASLLTDSPIIAVTGSNGKSTTVKILVDMCQSNTVHGVLAGNVGNAFSEKVLEELKTPNSKQVYILEISSFQMEFVDSFHPYISVFLNISPDHLDRHGSFENYLSAKLRLTKNQTANDYVIYNLDDPILAKEFANCNAQQITFCPNFSDNNYYHIDDTKIINKEYATLTELENIGLPGRHNLYNLLAAASGAHYLGITDNMIANVMHSFKGIPHRLESVAIINDVEYINDSKATNIDAVKVAIESFDKPIILILGGIAKGNDFNELLKYKSTLKSIIAYGNAREMINTELKNDFNLEMVELLSDAVKLCAQKSTPGDIVILSPGCASFDQFNNFEDRGNKFAQWVRELKV